MASPGGGTTGTAKNEIVALFPRETPFSTPKPERLLQRIIHIGSDPGDIVLDCFLGSGTTAAVCHKLDRRWVGIEWSRDTLERFAGPRLEKVVSGKDSGGLTEALAWEGGGGFRVLDVAPSMFAEEDRIVYLADWAVAGELGRATAAQLGFDYEPVAPFVGRKGKVRLGVIDGLVNPDVAKILVGALGDDERLTVCGTAVDPDTRDALKALRHGSTVRKIPSSILAEYRRPRWTWPRDEEAAEMEEPEQLAVG